MKIKLNSQLILIDDGWSGFVPFPIGIPVDGHLLPKVHPLVIGQSQIHLHLVSDVEMSGVVGQNRIPDEMFDFVAHFDVRFAFVGEVVKQLDVALGENKIFVG